MSIILKPSALKVKDDNGNYIGTNMFAAESTQEYLDAIETIGTQTQTAISTASTQAQSAMEAKAEQTIESIPDDYTELAGDVTELKADLTELEDDLNDKADEPSGTKSAGKVYCLDENLEPIWAEQSTGLDDQKINALWEVVKRIGAFTGTDGASVVNAFKTAWGAHDVVAITGVSVSGDVSHFYIGEQRQLTATLSPVITPTDQQYEEHTIAWSSSDATVATVDTTGLVSAVSAGDVRITCTVTADSGTYTDYIDVTATAEPAPLYTLSQGTGYYPADYGSLTISGNHVTYNCTHTTGGVAINLALLPDGSYYPTIYHSNENALFSISNGDEMTIEVSDISYQFPDADDGFFSFCLMDENNSAINNGGKQPIYRTTRPEGTSVSGTLAANRNAEVHGLRANIYASGVGSVSFDIKVYINGVRYY